MNNDPRQGLPSASGLHRMVNCPGSFRAAKDALAQALGELMTQSKKTELTYNKQIK